MTKNYFWFVNTSLNVFCPLQAESVVDDKYFMPVLLILVQSLSLMELAYQLWYRKVIDDLNQLIKLV